MRSYLLTLICVLVATFAASADEVADTIVVEELEPVVVEELEPVMVDTVAALRHHSNVYWIKQLFDNGFHLNDSNVQYPRFPRFCLKVYNWGDKVFNSYDPEYVVSTGKNWKLFAKSLNWGNNYEMLFSNDSRVSMMSNLYADIGGYISFMAVSVGYMFNANKLIEHDNINRSMLDFNFTCALFSGNISFNTTDGGVNIHRFGKYNSGKHINVPFSGVSNKSMSARAFYFFNHRRYSHAAAYCFSKYQLKSAGTWMAGFNLATQQINIDFQSLPEDMLANLPEGSLAKYNFHYRDYYLIGGYGYNWVLKPRKWLINGAIMPGLGYKHCYEDSSVGQRDMFAGNINVNFSVVYNNKSLFVSMQGRFDGNLYVTKDFTFFNTYENLLLTAGMRF